MENKSLIIKQLNEVFITPRTREWCKLPYSIHKQGCPNYGKKSDCPPKAPLFEKIVKKPYTLVAVGFNLKQYVEHMKKKHPTWSDKKARCLLYWQKKINKKLKEISEKTSCKIPNSIILYRPEANGVNVFRTCKNIGLILEKNPQKIVWKISIIGIKK